MKVSLSLEKTTTNDVSIMVDALRASTTITLALNNFEEIIPCFTPEEAIALSEKYNSIVAGERSGIKVEGFDVGNSPQEVESFEIPSDKSKTLILTTSNGTRILKDMESTVLIGSMVNAKAVAEKALELSSDEIDVVMAGYRGNFALEDFLVSGEIIYWIYEICKDCEFTDYAKASILASRNYDNLCKGIYNSNSGKKLRKIGNEKDVDCCILKNITNNVGIYIDNKIKLL
ncbi:MAG: 2-phosphosulfolactate phosphatase [Methanobrevibacter sp.]|uniref:2-phosphosulfolactate phosphatase n=1 Tax=Methanobrevibacter sp. TaxID=66852 RepID=UPI0026E0E31C|nr:2-phosphosulfolactate phosphatase [Methanobrevibacter sp.]MDO5848136.1 2-phosphosulfolactate phosphatase [Methanobrevibacter sp.]